MFCIWQTLLRKWNQRLEKIFLNHILDKELISTISKELSKLKLYKDKLSNFKNSQRFEKIFHPILCINGKYMWKYSQNQVNKIMQIKTIMICYYILEWLKFKSLIMSSEVQMWSNWNSRFWCNHSEKHFDIFLKKIYLLPYKIWIYHP